MLFCHGETYFSIAYNTAFIYFSQSTEVFKDVYREPTRTFKDGAFCDFAKSSISDVCLGSKYASNLNVMKAVAKVDFCVDLFILLEIVNIFITYLTKHLAIDVRSQNLNNHFAF